VIGVLIADDHPALRAGLEELLGGADDLSVVGSASNGDEAVALVRELRPDVVLMDLEMPDVDGVEATRRIAAEVPAPRVVVLTSFSDRPRILDALDAGAVGYLLKDAEPDELIRGIRVAAEGHSPLDPRAAAEVIDVHHARAEPQLSAREREILGLVAAGHPNKVVAVRLGISEKTVKNHLSAVFAKIEVTDRTQAALWAQRNGLG
jgi:DNA-binding NarL/FixJ family response regulator